MSAETDLLDMGAWEEVRKGCLDILEGARGLQATANDPFVSDEVRAHARRLLDIMDRVGLYLMAEEAMAEAVRELARLAGAGRCPQDLLAGDGRGGRVTGGGLWRCACGALAPLGRPCAICGEDNPARFDNRAGPPMTRERAEAALRRGRRFYRCAECSARDGICPTCAAEP